MTIFWILVGMPESVLGGVDKGVQAVLFVLSVYLLVGEHQRQPIDGGDGEDDA